MSRKPAGREPLPRLNVELKARRADLAEDRRTALALGAMPAGIEHQLDTYFICPHGRLKLRETDRREATLIGYARSDRPDARSCDYHLVPVPDPALLRAALIRALGLRGEVRKRREILLWENVRIHLDEVDALGCFLEFEAVMDTGDVATGEALLARLRAAFAIADADQIGVGYADLLGL